MALKRIFGFDTNPKPQKQEVGAAPPISYMEVSEENIQQFVVRLKQLAGYDFSSYSEKSFRRRVEKILMDHSLTVPQLIDRLEQPEFLEQIVREITVNTTELFRDPAAWANIEEFIVRHLAQAERIRIWSAGCSNGLELYSLIILLNELGMLDRADLFGSDLNSHMVERARSGQFPYRHDTEFFLGFQAVMQSGGRNVPIEKYFLLEKRSFAVHVRPEFTQLAQLRKHDLVSFTNPFEQAYDLILCRNVLIYFNHGLQERLFHFFHKQLQRKGALMLGVHEGMLGPVAEKYVKAGHLYYKL